MGIGESQVEALVGPTLETMTGLEIGYCARLGEVDLRLIGTAVQLDEAEKVVFPALGTYLLPPGGKSWAAFGKPSSAVAPEAAGFGFALPPAS